MKIKKLRKYCFWIVCLILVVLAIKMTIYFNDIAFVRNSVKNTFNIDLPIFKIIQKNNAGSLAEDNYNYQIKFIKNTAYLFDHLSKQEPSTHVVLKYRPISDNNIILWTQKFDYSTAGSDPTDPQKWVKIMINSNSDTATIQIINM